MKNIACLALLLAVAACRGKGAEATSAAGDATGGAIASATATSGAPSSASAAPAAGAEAAQPPAPPAKPVPAALPDILATVDDEKIERWELEGAIKGLEARAGAPIPTERRDEIIRGLLDQIVAYHLLAREAKDRKQAATEAEVTARMTQIRGSFPDEKAFQQALTAQGITLEQLQRQTRMGMDIDKVIQAEVAPTVKVEEAEIGAFYQQNLPQFAQGEAVHASHILIGTPKGADDKQKDAARTKAQQLLTQVKGGGDFAKIAKEQSQDPGSAPGGGDLGFFPKGQTDPAFETAAFGLKDGSVSELVETQFGFHIIKVHEHRAARTAPLAEVTDQIKEFLTGQQRDTKIQTFIEQAKAKRKVQILV